MKKITDIKTQVKTPTRCNIYLDNAFYCGMELETIMRHRLKIGTEIDPEKLAEIQAESESIRALDKALNFISRSQKTKKQVKEYLEKKGYLSSVIDVVLDKKAHRSGAFQKGRFALRYAGSLSGYRGRIRRGGKSRGKIFKKQRKDERERFEVL